MYKIITLNKLKFLIFFLFCFSLNLTAQSQVNFTSFTAQRALDKSKIDIKWTTSHESNVSRYIVQRKIGDGSFEDFVMVPYVPNTNTTKDYTFVDQTNWNLYEGQIYFRIKILFLNNLTHYSETNEVLITSLAFKPYTPLPGKWIKMPPNTSGILEIFDLKGSLVKRQINATGNIELNELNQGIYYVRLWTANGVSSTEPLLIN